jgi:hypothetical protein
VVVDALDLSLRFSTVEQHSRNADSVSNSANSDVGGVQTGPMKPVRTQQRDMTFALLHVEMVPISSNLKELTVRVRASNQGPYSDAFADTHSRLAVGGEEVLPQRHFNYRVLSGESREVDLRYRVPGDAVNARLRLRTDVGSGVEFPLDLQHVAGYSKR